ncbi:MAG: hypothetical protein CM15mV142_310 [Caudoviricetes sp.]|nr:MAG: hypothetical protein CM15mV142_310 [Caudoviricetes sp.]
MRLDLQEMREIGITQALWLDHFGVSDFRIDGVPQMRKSFFLCFMRLPNGTYTNDSSQFGVTWDQVKTKLDELNNAEPIRLLREERDRRLTECDWIITKNKELGANIPAAWKTYRQSLRDLQVIQIQNLMIIMT